MGQHCSQNNLVEVFDQTRFNGVFSSGNYGQDEEEEDDDDEKGGRGVSGKCAKVKSLSR